MLGWNFGLVFEEAHSLVNRMLGDTELRQLLVHASNLGLSILEFAIEAKDLAVALLAGLDARKTSWTCRWGSTDTAKMYL